jgi:N-acetylneuraminate epimerase
MIPRALHCGTSRIALRHCSRLYLMSVKTLFALLLAAFSSSAFAGEWKQLPSLPDAEGFAGSFAGVSNGALLIAGGANFPGKKPWEGGMKVWYDTVFVLESPAAKWKVAGRLPRRLGYGVSVTYNNGLICAGGSDRDRHYPDVFRIEWSNGKLKTTPLPSLPPPIANCCGAIVGNILYVAGGIEKPDAKETSNRAWQLELSSKSSEWIEIMSWPGSRRMLAVAAGFKDAFWLIGGVDLTAGSDGTTQRHYLTDAFRYDLNGWKRIADLPHSVVAAPSPAPFDKDKIYLLGGDDGSQVNTPPDKHRGFGNKTLRYNVTTDQWTEAGLIAAPRATLPTAFWNNSWVLPGGEVRPGVRSPQVWNWTPGTTE